MQAGIPRGYRQRGCLTEAGVDQFKRYWANCIDITPWKINPVLPLYVIMAQLVLCVSHSHPGSIVFQQPQKKCAPPVPEAVFFQRPSYSYLVDNCLTNSFQVWLNRSWSSLRFQPKSHLRGSLSSFGHEHLRTKQQNKNITLSEFTCSILHGGWFLSSIVGQQEPRNRLTPKSQPSSTNVQVL